MLSRMAKIPPALVIVEMLSDEGALGRDEARAIAESMGSLLLDGKEIMRGYGGW
jgi:3,4-dihydroxy-2-butanone 4-phosphate synthase